MTAVTTERLFKYVRDGLPVEFATAQAKRIFGEPGKAHLIYRAAKWHLIQTLSPDVWKEAWNSEKTQLELAARLAKFTQDLPSKKREDVRRLCGEISMYVGSEKFDLTEMTDEEQQIFARKTRSKSEKARDENLIARMHAAVSDTNARARESTKETLNALTARRLLELSSENKTE